MAETYTGGCQCGAVRYEAEASLDHLIACNCSRCGRAGFILAFVPADQFKLLAGEGAQTQFHFNTHKIHHQFCSTCGIESFAYGTGPDGKEMVALNVRCFDGVDPNTLEPQAVDGRKF
jgi:hypothetical protein